jgi:hypothetical protein
MGLGSGSEIRDPESEKNPFRIPIPDPGVKKAPDPGSRIRNTGRNHSTYLLAHWVEEPTASIRRPIG